MNIAIDRETRIAGLGLTQDEAMTNMQFYVERSGRLSTSHLERRKQIHAWLPKPNVIHVKGIGAIECKGNVFTNLRTGRKVNVLYKPLSHYLCLYNAFDGLISYEDFTITVAKEIDEFMLNVYGNSSTLNDFPYIKPVESLNIKHYHSTYLDGISVMETVNKSIVVSADGKIREVEKVMGVSSDCLLAYLFASMGFMYDGEELKRSQ